MFYGPAELGGQTRGLSRAEPRHSTAEMSIVGVTESELSSHVAGYLMSRGTGVFGFTGTGFFFGFFTSRLPLSLLPMFDSFA